MRPRVFAPQPYGGLRKPHAPTPQARIRTLEKENVRLRAAAAAAAAAPAAKRARTAPATDARAGAGKVGTAQLRLLQKKVVSASCALPSHAAFCPACLLPGLCAAPCQAGRSRATRVMQGCIRAETLVQN